jgi:hypothetical protein
MTSLIQPSFTGGELSPSLHGRVDLARYLTSLKTCRNFIAQQYGGVTNRSGTRFIEEVYSSSSRHRLIPFEFSTTQTYILEFGNLTMRIYKDGGIVESSPGVPVVVATPYTTADLPNLNWTQSADVLTIVHPSYYPRQISRTSHTAWTVTAFANVAGPFQDINVNESITVYASGITGSVTLNASSSLFNPSMIGTKFYLEQKDFSFVDPWESYTKLAGVGDNPLGLRRYSDGKNYICVTDHVVSGGGIECKTGTVRPVHDKGVASDGAAHSVPDVAELVGVEWEFTDPGYGYLLITAYTDDQTVTATVISDWDLPASLGSSGGASYKWAKDAWGGNQGYPSAVTYYQDRQIFAGTTAQPQSTWMSKTANYLDFGVSRPLVADDAITFPVRGRQVNAVRHLVPMDNLVILTSGSEWKLSTGQNDVVAPDTIAVKPQSYRGSSKIPPIVVGNTALYIQDKGKTIQELAFEFASDTYTGQDLTQLASHLFAGYTIKEWAYQQVPFQVVWCVRSDGVLLGLTYLKEQQVVGWHRHDTDGEFESVACISEGTEDVLYAIVKRTIDGTTKRYVERMNTRQFDDPSDWFFVDSGLSYDGRNTTSKTITLTTSTNWTYQQGAFTATASASTFASTDVGSEIHFPIDDQIIKIAITGYTSATVVTGTANRDIPVALRSTATTDWSIARSAFSGMDHLEGKACSVLADGNVHPQVTVDSGDIELQYAAAVVHVGLPITADLETLSLTAQSQETILDKKKLITSLRMIVEDTRGITVGPNANHLTEIKQRTTENYDQAISATTGIMESDIPSDWSKDGRVFIRQSDPLPATILAVMPDVTVGGA